MWDKLKNDKYVKDLLIKLITVYLWQPSHSSFRCPDTKQGRQTADR